MKNTIIILLSCLLLSSCQRDIQRPKEVLDQQKLSEKLKQLDTFHQFLEAQEKLNQEVADKRKHLDQKDHWWVLHIHKKYPEFEDFLLKAPIRSIRKYALLTGIDVLNGTSGIYDLLQQIHAELEDRYIFQKGDLSELLFYSYSTNQPQASIAKNNCLKFCDNEANEEFERVLESCTRSDIMYCQYRALMARHYFHRGCMAGCNYQEE